MGQWIGSTLAQMTACRLFGTKPLSKPVLGCCRLALTGLRNKLQWNFDQKTIFFIHVNVSENIVSEMAGILSRRRWDKRLTQAVSRDFGNTTSFFNTITRNLWKPHNFLMITAPSFDAQYRQTSTINRTLGGNKVVDHSDEVAPTTSSFSIEHMTSLDCAKTTARRNEIHLMFGICMFYRFQGNCFDSRQLWLRLPAVSVDAN